MTRFSKEPIVRDERWLAELRRKRCDFCQAWPRSQAHHVKARGMGGASRRDDLAIPVCLTCHMRCEGQTVAGANGERLGPIARDLQRERALAWQGEWRRWCDPPPSGIPA